MQTEIWVTVQVPGIHNWPEAPTVVRFLREHHRHLFKVKAGLAVTHDDRESEFFVSQRVLLDVMNQAFDHNCYGFQFEARSCEMIAKRLMELKPEYLWVEVSEDGENGAIVRR